MNKNQWKKPVLEVLDINLTMGGNGTGYADCWDTTDVRGYDKGKGHDDDGEMNPGIYKQGQCAS
nr:paeninodin family lasso peptide [Litchfieldia alkalitelluris]